MTVIPFRTMEGCVQIPKGEIGNLKTCRECSDDICRRVSDKVRILSTKHFDITNK